MDLALIVPAIASLFQDSTSLQLVKSVVFPKPLLPCRIVPELVRGSNHSLSRFTEPSQHRFHYRVVVQGVSQGSPHLKIIKGRAPQVEPYKKDPMVGRI